MLWGAVVNAAIDDLSRGIIALEFRNRLYLQGDIKKDAVMSPHARGVLRGAMVFLFDKTCELRCGMKATDALEMASEDADGLRYTIKRSLYKKFNNGQRRLFDSALAELEA